MGIKRKAEENVEESEKKTKVNDNFSIEIFVRNLKDPESSFLGKFDRFIIEKMRIFVLALSEFNEHVRHLSSEETIDELIENLLQYLKSNLDDVLALITDEKRKASEVSNDFLLFFIYPQFLF
jgi:hypothetical protein